MILTQEKRSTVESQRKFLTKTDLAYERIKLAIIEGKYSPGQKIVISRVADELNISDIPVREGLKTLESEGFVQNIPHVGFLVTSPEFKDHAKTFDVRQLLEGQATALAAGCMSRDAIARLRGILEEMKTALGRNDMVEMSNLNYRFHDLIYASCGNGLLYRLIEQVWSLFPRTRSIFSLIPERAAGVTAEHEEIYLALEAGDAQRAQQALLAHKRKSYDLLMQYDSKLNMAAQGDDQVA